MLRPLLTLALIAIAFASHSQYILKWNDVPYSYDKSPAFKGRGLGQKLLDGYLRGKLKAYDFYVNSEDLKWKAPLPEDYPSAWVSKFEYMQAEVVTWKGKCYESKRNVVNTRKEPHKNPDDWKEFQLRGVPVSTRYWFPTDKDTTSKAEFLSKFNMALYPGYASEWDSKTDYTSYDIVKYRDRYFASDADNLNKRPDLFTDIWREVKESIGFASPYDLEFFSILYAVDGARTIPQMLSLYHFDRNRDVIQCPGLNFRYEDVCAYLADQKTMPMIYDAPFGYTGQPQLMYASDSLVKIFQSNIKAGKLKPAAHDILRGEDYELFLDVDLNVTMDVAWSFRQDLKTHDLTMFVEYPGDSVYDMLKLPWISVEPFIKETGATLKMTSYLDWLNSFNPNTTVDTLSIDSLAPRMYPPVKATPPTKIFYVSEHRVSTKKNPALASAMRNLWTVMKTGVEEKKIQLSYSGRDLFPCDQILPTMTLKYGGRDWTLKDFTFSPPYEAKIDTADLSRPVRGIEVQYIRPLSPASAVNTFEPHKIALVLDDPEDAGDPKYYFNWRDVTDAAKDHPEFQPLIDAIVKANLVTDWTEVAEGPMAEW